MNHLEVKGMFWMEPPHKIMLTMRDNGDYNRVLLYSYYNTGTGWGVYLYKVYLRGCGRSWALVPWFGSIVRPAATPTFEPSPKAPMTGFHPIFSRNFCNGVAAEQEEEAEEEGEEEGEEVMEYCSS